MVTRTALAPAVAALVVIYAVCTVAAHVASLDHEAVPLAIGFDLTVTAGVVFWWLAIRPGHARPRALISVVALGFAAAKLLVGMRALGAVAVVGELAVVALLAVRIRKIRRIAKAERAAGRSLPAALDAGFAAVLPSRAIASVLATEIALLILAITGWVRRPPAGWSMHRRSSYLVVIGVLAFLVIVESVVMHVVIARAFPTVAIVVSALSAYSLLWLIGQAQAVRLSPLRVIGDDLVIERGALARATVPRALIAEATAIDGKVEGAANLSLLEPSVLLTLREPVVVHGMLGRTRTADRIAISVDDRDTLIAFVTPRQ